MKNLNLQTRLILLLVLPLVGVMYFSVRDIWTKWNVVRESRALEGVSVVLNELGATVHELQKERGRSAVFLGSQGRRFGSEMAAQQQATAAAVARLEAAAAAFDATEFGAGFAADFAAGIGALDQLAARRAAVNAVAVSAVDATAFFTATINRLADLAAQVAHVVTDHDVAIGMNAYVNYMYAKEHTGIERAVLSGAFAADKFAGDAFVRFNHAVAKQDAFLEVFASFATAGQKALVGEKARSSPVQAAAQMRQVAYEKAETGGFGIPSNTFFDTISEKIDLMREVEDRLSADYMAIVHRARSAATRSLTVLFVCTLAILAATVAFSIWTIRSITGPLRTAIVELTASSLQVSSGAGQIAASSQQLAEGASEQAASLEETSASLEEMTSMVRRNAEAAGKAKVLANETRAAADAGSADMAEMKNAMNEIKASSSEVAKIVKDIDEIAFQTNILALNAAVEAARAGEAGMGFAVVADEVRNLAHRSAGSAKETAAKIEDAIAKSERGVQISSRVALSFEQIAGKTREVDQYVAEIATASHEQAQGVSQVNTAVTQMDQVTQANAASAEECASAAEELSAQAGTVNDSVHTLQLIVGGTASRATRTLPDAPAPAPRPTADDTMTAAPRPRFPAPNGAPGAKTAKAPAPASVLAHRTSLVTPGPGSDDIRKLPRQPAPSART